MSIREDLALVVASHTRNSRGVDVLKVADGILSEFNIKPSGDPSDVLIDEVAKVLWANTHLSRVPDEQDDIWEEYRSLAQVVLTVAWKVSNNG